MGSYSRTRRRCISQVSEHRVFLEIDVGMRWAGCVSTAENRYIDLSSTYVQHRAVEIALLVHNKIKLGESHYGSKTTLRMEEVLTPWASSGIV